MIEKRLPNALALRVFATAARHGSFVSAAEELNVTHGAVSKQVQALELELDAKLFERRNRGVHLTDRGAWLASRLAPVFDGLERTMREFRALDGPTAITISCEPTLCLKMLIPSLAELQQSTGFDVRVLAAGGSIDFRRDNVDLAIRRNDFPKPAGSQSTFIGHEWMGPVVAPDCQSSDRLHSATRPEAWQTWDSGGFSTATKAADRKFEHFYLAIQAAEAGQGMALASVHMVARDLERARLVAPHGFRRDGTDYVALRAADRGSTQVDVITSWISEKMTRNVERWVGV